MPSSGQRGQQRRRRGHRGEERTSSLRIEHGAVVEGEVGADEGASCLAGSKTELDVSFLSCQENAAHLA